MEKTSNRYDGAVPEHTMPEHTFQKDCPACRFIRAEMTPEQNQELVNALMKQFDGMVDRAAARAKKFAAEKLVLLLSTNERDDGER